MFKISLDVPKKMAALAKLEETKDRPYDLCLECPFFNDTCDGPNVLAMENDRWGQWANARAKSLGLTRQDIADKSNLPIGTVISVMSGRTKDARYSTIRAITQVLIGGCWGQYPCHFAALLLNDSLKVDESIQEMEEELAELRDRYRALRTNFEARVAEVKADENKKVLYLKNQLQKAEVLLEKREKRSGKLTVIIVVLLVVLFGLLLVDALIPTMGWIQY